MAVVSPTKRIDLLARPKPNPAGFIDDCRSVYWNNHIAKDWSSGDNATKFSLSERLEQLVLPKHAHKEWKGDRPSPIWIVSKSALKAEPSERIKSLSDPKHHHRDYRHDKSVFTVVTPASLKAAASQRVEALAKPKQFQELPIKPDSCWDYSEWKSDVSNAALNHNSTERTTQLAVEKALHREYKGSRSVVWNVSKSARNTLPSLRVQQLARPKDRSCYKEDYHNNWWKVSPSAKTASVTPRIEELSQPIPWKVRQKKGTVTKS